MCSARDANPGAIVDAYPNGDRLPDAYTGYGDFESGAGYLDRYGFTGDGNTGSADGDRSTSADREPNLGTDDRVYRWYRCLSRR